MFSISFQLKSQHFPSLSIVFKLFNYFLSCLNRLYCDDLDWNNEFRSKKSIKSWFDHNIKRNLTLDWLDHWRLLSISVLLSILSLGDFGSGIELLTIWIPSCPNLIVDYNMNLITTADSSRQSQFQSNFDLFFIKVDQFGSYFDLSIEIRLKMIDWKIKIIE